MHKWEVFRTSFNVLPQALYIKPFLKIVFKSLIYLSSLKF